ncbi:Ankyrin repeat protein [Mycena venus]|uniref:Ankyrin repeat protein n=1 Tax=Mycena venus TaxID=2733690 RepID=A0A8H6XIT8_9AGAR|nr:Ankyrin repeat protein [Mycena venus]
MKRSALQWIRRKCTSDDSHSPSPTSSPGGATSGPKKQLVLETLIFALDLAQQALAIAEVTPFVAPAAVLLRSIIKSSKELNSANEERGVLAAYIADLTGDICATVLRMQETNHSDQIGRLKQDLERYFTLIDRVSGFIEIYDELGRLGRFAGRRQLSEELDKFTRELNSFGARFANNRLVDLYINQGANTRVLQEVLETVTHGKLEIWLCSPPDMKQMQRDTEKLRTEGTGQWFFEDRRYIEWENNAGILWIEGPSGAGKTVLSSAVIQKLFTDTKLFEDETKNPPAVAFFYFNFRNNDTQNVEIMLRRIVLQLSAASPHPYRILNDQYKLSSGQRLPSYQELVEILKQLLRDLGRTYIVLDALDECDAAEFDQLVGLVATLRPWTETPLHILITSQTRSIFTKGFGGIPHIHLKFELQQADIKLFLESEFRTNPDLTAWKSQKPKVVDGIARKSKGMFRLASCLLQALSQRLYGEPEELDETLKSLPNDLVTIYDRFIEAIPQPYISYVEAALRWILFSTQPLSLVQLADAISFDFTPGEYTYKPNRRASNEAAIPKWLGGLVVIRLSYMSGTQMVTLAHASVPDYLRSDHLKNKFSCDVLEGVSHTFILQTCLSYLLYFGHPPQPGDSEYRDKVKYPLLEYAATQWYHHLSYSHDRESLLPMAMQILEEASLPYRAMVSGATIRDWPIHQWRLDLSPLHHCCREGYIECVRCLVGNGVDLNGDAPYGSPLSLASFEGRMDIVHFLLKNGANVNQVCGKFDSALAAASYGDHYGDQVEIVHLLLENGADVNLAGKHFGSALAAASHRGKVHIVHFLLDNGADVNLTGGVYGSALAAASFHGRLEIARVLLENGADVNLAVEKYGSALAAASYYGQGEMVLFLLHNGADIRLAGGRYGGALTAASYGMELEIVRLLLKNGADVNLAGGDYGSALAATCASPYGRRKLVEIVHLLLENGADLKSQGTRALEEASKGGHDDIVALLRRRLDGVRRRTRCVGWGIS